MSPRTKAHMRKTILLALVASLSACSLAPSAPRQLECRSGWTISLGRNGEEECVPIPSKAPARPDAPQLPAYGFTISAGRIPVCINDETGEEVDMSYCTGET